MEVFKTTEIATQIRDAETAGRASIHEFVCEDENEMLPEEVIQFLGEPPEKYNEATEDEIPIEQQMKNQNQNSRLRKPKDLYHVSSDTGELIVKKIASSEERNIKKSLLFTGDCYILDNGCEGTIYVWKGKEASPDERKGAMLNAMRFIEDHGYPAETKIVVIPENVSHPVFQECFNEWK